jgi:SAM-dependent methyltransferase
MDARGQLAAHFLSGEGLEIGPLHQPLTLPPHAKARYVDRMSLEDLRSEYPELAGWNLTTVDVIDDGELLTTIAEGSQDFIVANHFLEHTENPINTIRTHLGKLKPGGVLFYAVPDKRFTFDFRRPVTPLEEMVADYEEGPERSRRAHYDEWTRLVIDANSPHAGKDEPAAHEEWAEAKARELEAAAYSIHMHVWTQAEFLKLILECRERCDEGFDIEAAARQLIEFMVVLRKAGPPPAPVPPANGAPPAPAATSGSEDLRNASRKAIAKVRRELQRRRAKS